MRPWKKLKEEPYKAGFRKMIKRWFEMPNGQTEEFDIANNEEVVCCLALTTDQQVILTKQFRPAQERILLELPGGGLESEETPEEAMSRELLEETGYTGNMQFVAKSLASGYDTLVRYNFVITDCQKIQEPNEEDTRGTAETILMSISDFKKHLKSAELTDVATGYLGLEYLELIK